MNWNKSARAPNCSKGPAGSARPGGSSWSGAPIKHTDKKLSSPESSAANDLDVEYHST